MHAPICSLALSLLAGPCQRSYFPAVYRLASAVYPRAISPLRRPRSSSLARRRPFSKLAGDTLECRGSSYRLPRVAPTETIQGAGAERRWQQLAPFLLHFLHSYRMNYGRKAVAAATALQSGIRPHEGHAETEREARRLCEGRYFLTKMAKLYPCAIHCWIVASSPPSTLMMLCAGRVAPV